VEDLLVELLQAAPQLKLLVTSREPLNLQEEWRYEVFGLPFPDQECPALAGVTADPQEFEAVQLLFRPLIMP
jgi:predicted ATPase